MYAQFREAIRTEGFALKDPQHVVDSSPHMISNSSSMTKLILSTSNVMSGSPSILRRPASEKSNVELVNSLRSNIQDAKHMFAPAMIGNAATYDKQEKSTESIPYTQWTATENDIIFVPSLEPDHSGLSEERTQYDITAKLFFLPNAAPPDRFHYTQEAVDLVLRELRVPSIDLLIVSFSGVSFDGEEDCYDPFTLDKPPIDRDNMHTMLETWKALEYLHNEGLALRIGVAELSSDRLQQFLPKTQVRPSVNQINVRDCCTVPTSLVQYAKEEKIELLTHSDCTNILPSGTIRELLGTDKKGAGLLVGSCGQGEGIKGDIVPQWVIKYTAVVRDRGVIENKGYFAMAEIHG